MEKGGGQEREKDKEGEREKATERERERKGKRERARARVEYSTSYECCEGRRGRTSWKGAKKKVIGYEPTLSRALSPSLSFSL